MCKQRPASEYCAASPRRVGTLGRITLQDRGSRCLTTGIKARPTPNNGLFPIIETRTCVVKKRVEGRCRPVAHRHNSGRFTYPIDLFRRAWIIHDNGKGYVPSAEPEKCSGYFWRASGPEIGTSSRFVASRHGLSMRLNL